MISHPEPYEYIPLTEAATWLGMKPLSLLRWCRSHNIEILQFPHDRKTTYQVHYESLKTAVKANAINPRPEKRPVGRPRTMPV